MTTITQWAVISDQITEDAADPSGQTQIEVTYKPRRGDTVEQAIARGRQDCYRYIDPNGFSCVRAAGHPDNGWRLSMGHRPVFCQNFSVAEDKENPFLILVTLQWAIPEAIQGPVPLEREPPRRIQHVVPRISLVDPNTKFPHTTTAGEMIRGVQVDWRYGGLSYSIREPRIPDWFEVLQEGPINADDVRLAGKLYPPKTLWAVSCTSVPLRIREGVYWEEISLDLLHDPDGWDEKYPNVGTYELLLRGQTTVAPVKAVDIMARIQSRADANRFAAAARSGRPIQLPIGPNGANLAVTVLKDYVPIKTYLRLPYRADPEPEIEDVEKPVMLDQNGLAFRELRDGNPLKTTDFQPTDIVTLSLTTRLKVPFARMGLW